MAAVYDRIGNTYGSTRRSDPRIAALIHRALPPSATVVNVEPGTGSYEPTSSFVVAVEPSQTMIAQRGALAAPAVRAVAEALPFASQSVDVVLGILTLHHWSDLARGLDECRRVARRRVIFLTWDPSAANFWLVDEYFPQILDDARAVFVPMRVLAELLGPTSVTVIPIPGDCADGFLGAFWQRPSAYLDPAVRRGISAFASIPDATASLARLEADIVSGAWDRRHAHLRSLDALDLGYRLVVADVS